MPGVGHNQLTSLVERIENISEEIKGLSADRSVIFAEAKVLGYNTKVLREVIRLRQMRADDLKERNELLEQYGSVLGLDLL
jgi:uncharacterized protein (UPF0335 family)